MNNSELISFIEVNFPVCLGNVEVIDGNVSWSVDIDDRDENNKLYEKLLGYEGMFEGYGYELILQDDDEYFGAMFIKK